MYQFANVMSINPNGVHLPDFNAANNVQKQSIN